MVLVDTNIWIRAVQKNGDLMAKVALETLLEEGEAAFCGPVKLEFLGAVRLEHRKRFDTLFASVTNLPADESIWDDAIKIARRVYDETRFTMPWNDMLIAAIALRHDVRVYSLDRHFAVLANVVGIKLYIPGSGGKFAPAPHVN